MNDKINEINIKIDHLMRVTAEIFIMLKGNNNIDNKIDQCLKSLNTMNSSLTTLINNQNKRSYAPPPMPRPRGQVPRSKPLPPYKKPNKDNKPKVSSGGYMAELKKKLKERNKKMNIKV